MVHKDARGHTVLHEDTYWCRGLHEVHKDAHGVAQGHIMVHRVT